MIFFFCHTSICPGYSFELHLQADAIQMSTHNICLYTGDCTIIGVCMVIRSNMVTFFITSVLTLTGTVLVFRWSVDLLGGLFGDKSRIFFFFLFLHKNM